MSLSRVLQVLRDRQNKQQMADASYWDARAAARGGFARSVWHSENFSRVWDRRQQEILRDALRASLGDLRGKRIADVGCGTGRITRFLAREGATAVGFDFSPATVKAAADETTEAGLEAEFVVADVTTGEFPQVEPFDAALTVGCLAVACRDLDSLERAFRGIATLVASGSPVFVLEPIHTSKLLGRVLRAPVSAWLDAADRAGLPTVGTRGMGFVPVRLALSSLDLPEIVVDPAFAIGEAAIDRVPLLDRASDYHLLRLRKR